MQTAVVPWGIVPPCAKKPRTPEPLAKVIKSISLAASWVKRRFSASMAMSYNFTSAVASFLFAKISVRRRTLPHGESEFFHPHRPHCKAPSQGFPHRRFWAERQDNAALFPERAAVPVPMTANRSCASVRISILRFCEKRKNFNPVRACEYRPCIGGDACKCLF